MRDHTSGRVKLKDGVEEIANWLADGARSADKSEDFLDAFCERLLSSGIAVSRVAIFVHTLHPQIMGRRFQWRRGERTKVMAAPYTMADDHVFLTSPVYRVRKTGETLRRRLCDPTCVDDFPILSELREEGVSDYFAAPLHFINGEIHVAAFTTNADGGFSDSDFASLIYLLAPLARIAEVRALRRIAINLLDAYVGHDAGERILSGKIMRGDSERIRAAIWLSDMRGFTKLTDRLPPERVIERLNSFFDCLLPAIEAEGGDVLKFMGDGLLAIFRAGDKNSDDEARRRALKAAVAARANVRALNDGADPGEFGPLRFGLALHFGEALYGNIGGGSRLDFTCIGPAINLAARIEKVAARLERTVVASRAFAGGLAEEFEPLGAFELAGFQERQELYGLPDEGKPAG